MSVGPIEARFHAELLKRMEIDPAELGDQRDRANWPHAREVFARVFKTRTRDEWCARLEGSDACFAPVLTVAEAPQHAHLRERGTFVEIDGIEQPAPAPRFSRTQPGTPTPPQAPDCDSALVGWKTDAEIDALKTAGVL